MLTDLVYINTALISRLISTVLRGFLTVISLRQSPVCPAAIPVERINISFISQCFVVKRK